MLICQSRVYLYSGHIKIMGFTLLLNFVSISGVLKHYKKHVIEVIWYISWFNICSSTLIMQWNLDYVITISFKHKYWFFIHVRKIKENSFIILLYLLTILVLCYTIKWCNISYFVVLKSLLLFMVLFV